MKVASEIPNSSTYSNLGYNALYLIATLPEEEKQAQLERVEQGDNPTVRELQEVRRKLKESEERNKRLEERALQKEVVEKEVIIEKVPDDYESTKNLNSDLLNKNRRLNYDNENLQRIIKIKQHELKQLEDDSCEAVALKETIESLRTDKEKLDGTYKNAMELSSLLSEFENFFDEKMAPLRFKAVIAGLGTEFQLKKLRDMLTLVDSWLTEMNKVIPDEGRKIIEGEIING
jgi:predicted RNase H-like nuclease (RuvC/YqgF family)